MQCPSCGVYTISPWPSAAELDAAYADAYRPASGRFLGPGDRILRWTRSRLAGRVDGLAPAGRVLDVGSGEGWLVDALRRRGRDAQGVERGDEGWPDGPWSAVVLWHSLEHLSDPADALDKLANELVRGGIVVVALPNAASLQARAFGDRWLALDPPRHLVHVPADALLNGLEDRGLRVERISHWRGGQVAIGWLHGLVELLPGRPNLFHALRRPPARSKTQAIGWQPLALIASVPLFPVAVLLSAVEVLVRRAGSVYVEARRV